MRAATVPGDAYVSGLAAMRVTGKSKHVVLKLAAMGEIRTLAEPGSAVKFNAEDCERVARGRASS